jgi:hypothetical protein
MRLFHERKLYAYAFGVYVINALLVSCHGHKPETLGRRPPLLSIVVPQIIGMLFLALLASLAARRTSSTLEKCVLILTAIICLLSVASVLPRFNYDLPKFLIQHLVFVIASYALAMLSGWRMTQVLTRKKGSE